MLNESSNQTLGTSERSDDLPLGALAHGACNVCVKMRGLLDSEEGPAAVEYAVMLALIVLVCISAISTIGTKASSVFSKIANSL